MPFFFWFIINFRGAFIDEFVSLSPDFMGFGASHAGQEDDSDAGRLGQLSGCRHLLNTSIVEGINNTIKVIKRWAYGYRGQESFFLKIRTILPNTQR